MTASTLVEALDRRARRQPDALLFTFHDKYGNETERYTYRQFAERTAGLAEQLRSRGLRHGQRALLLHTPGLELVAALFACARLGAISAVAPMASLASLRAPAVRTRLAGMVVDCDPAIALSNQAQLASMEAAGALAGMPVFATDDSPLASKPVRGNEHEIVLLQYTSGSTSEPKGVCVSHANVIANAVALLDHVPVGVSWLPQYHDMGLIGYYLFPLVKGGRTHGFGAGDFLRKPSLWLRMMSTCRATFSSAPNFGFEYSLQPGKVTDDELLGVDLSHLRILLNGAEPVRPETCRRFVERFGPLGLRPEALVAAYGLAEATLAVTRGSPRCEHFDAEQLARGDAAAPSAGTRRIVELASCGPPLEGVALRIRSPESGADLGERAVGEICIAGASVTSGYWRARHDTRADRESAGTAETMHRTGDLGFRLGGDLYVCGRSKDLLIRHGQNHHPQDLEAAVEDPAVRPRGTVAYQDDERIVLVVEAARRDALPHPARLANQVAAATGLVVDRVILVPAHSVARTSSGKLARSETRRRLEAGQIETLATFDVPMAEHDARATVAEWLAQALERSPALAHASLTEAGIDSLGLVQLQLELQEGLRVVCPEHDFAPLDGPSLQDRPCADVVALAEAIRQGCSGTARSRASALAHARDQARLVEWRQMGADAQWTLPAFEARSRADAGTHERVLFTGATGFFGPYLLACLLEQTADPILVLARGTSDADAHARIVGALKRSRVYEAALANGFHERVTAWQGDLSAPLLGLSGERWAQLEGTRLAIYHNGASVDYVRTYLALRPANVQGTHTILQLAMRGAPKALHYVSSTFIFGWTRKGILHESDNNDPMEALDFGYSQSKWVAEQLVHRAAHAGLPAVVYRPSLISVSGSLQGDTHDVAARLLAFMIRHQVAVDTPNQISLLPADVLAHNLVAISRQRTTGPATYHLTADRYHSLTDLTKQIGRDFGYRFEYFDIPGFIERLNRLAGPADPVFPLLDFFNRSAPHIEAMSLKRYDNARYREARMATGSSLPDPTLQEMGRRLVFYLVDQGWIRAAHSTAELLRAEAKASASAVNANAMPANASAR